MKNNRNGKARVLTCEQICELLDALDPKYKLLYAICYFTGSRINEALQLKRSDIVGDRIIFRAKTTKTNDTRDLPINPCLRQIINDVGLPASGFLFPGQRGRDTISKQSADTALRKACDYIGLEGVSSHSFRRSNITHLHEKNYPLKVIQRWTGHKDANSLLEYIDIAQDTIDEAGLSLGF